MALSLKPTPRQLIVLKAIFDFMEKEGYPPTIRDIGEKLNIGSLRGVTVHLDTLERRGLIERNSISRGIRILPKAGLYYLTEQDKRDILIAVQSGDMAMDDLMTLLPTEDVFEIRRKSVARARGILNYRKSLKEEERI